MPPLCTPEKHEAPQVERSDVGPEAGYVTPPHSSCFTISDNPKKDKEDKHIKWLTDKFPSLSQVFKLHKQIGEGTFSAVFMASLLDSPDDDRLFAVKHLVPTTHPVRIEVELRCLKLIGGSENVVGLDLCLREKENIVFVMPYLEHNRFSEYFYDMDASETALYIKNLLIAVQHVHKFGIIHRDIKPNNFLYNRANKKFLLVDFGLAQVCSTNEKAKEVVLETLKRKRDSPVADVQLDRSEPPAKRKALESRNLNALASTVHHLETTSKTNTCTTKENSPRGLSSPKKRLRTPKKTPGTSSQRLPGQRRLFETSDDPKSGTFSKPAPPIPDASKKPSPLFCKCYGRPMVCKVCIARNRQEAPRAGTPGFRPPEVLLKYPNQTTAVDMWAVGIILLCILSGSYPFFRASDDVTALAEMITLFGTDKMRNIAKVFGKQLTCSANKPQLDLRKVCCKVRARGTPSTVTTNVRCPRCTQFTHNCLCIGVPMVGTEDVFPDSAYDLLKQLLDVNPHTRITAEGALKHTFLTQ